MENSKVINFKYWLTLAVAMLSASLVHGADQPNAAEAKLREALRNTMLQLRTAQTEHDTLQVANTQLEQDKKGLSDELTALKKKSAADEAAAEKTAAETNARLSAKEQEAAALQASLDKWKAAYQEAAGVAAAKEGARSKLAVQVAQLQHQVSDQQMRNREMYKIGTDILQRYEHFGLGTAIGAREPFVGTMRVKLENLVQDLGDKLAEQRIKPEAASSTPREGVAKP